MDSQDGLGLAFHLPQSAASTSPTGPWSLTLAESFSEGPHGPAALETRQGFKKKENTELHSPPPPCPIPLPCPLSPLLSEKVDSLSWLVCVRGLSGTPAAKGRLHCSTGGKLRPGRREQGLGEKGGEMGQDGVLEI